LRSLKRARAGPGAAAGERHADNDILPHGRPGPKIEMTVKFQGDHKPAGFLANAPMGVIPWGNSAKLAMAAIGVRTRVT